MRELVDPPTGMEAWPWEALPAGRWLGRLGLAGLVIVWAWVLAGWPLPRAAAILLATAAGVLILLRPGLGFPLLALAIPFGSLFSLSLGLGAVGPEELLLGAIAGAWLLRQLAWRRLHVAWPPFVGAGLVLLAAMLVSFLPASSPMLAAKELVKWVELWLAAILVLNVAGDVEATLLVFGLLVAGAAEGLLGLYQFFARQGPSGFMLMGRFMRAAGTFEQPNPYGGYLGLTLPLAAGVLLRTGLKAWAGRCHWGLRAIWLVALLSGGLMVGGLLASWSRGAWLGAAAGLAVVVAARGGRWLWGTVAAAAFGALLCLALWGRVPLPGALEQRFADVAADLALLDVRNAEVNDSNFAVVERTAHWQAAWGMFNAHPWTGVGLGNYPAAYEKYALPRWPDAMGHAHNYFLNIAAEAGLPGLAAYLLWVGAGFWVAWKAVRSARGFWGGIALGILGVLVHLSVHNLFDNLYVHGMGIQVGLLLGLAAWIVKRSALGNRAQARDEGVDAAAESR